MKTNVFAAAIAAGLLACSAAHALTNDEYKAAKARIEADYKAEKAQCGTLKDNAKDVCEEQAEAKEELGKAELANQFAPSPANAKKLAETKAEGTYEVAKEKCDGQSGELKKACEQQAKADYDKAKADIKATKF